MTEYKTMTPISIFNKWQKCCDLRPPKRYEDFKEIKLNQLFSNSLEKLEAAKNGCKIITHILDKKQ